MSKRYLSALGSALTVIFFISLFGMIAVYLGLSYFMEVQAQDTSTPSQAVLSEVRQVSEGEIELNSPQRLTLDFQKQIQRQTIPEQKPTPTKTITKPPSKLEVTLPQETSPITLYEDSVGFEVEVTNLGEASELVQVTVDGPGGLNIPVKPDFFNLNPGGTQDVFITIQEVPAGSHSLLMTTKTSSSTYLTTIYYNRQGISNIKTVDSGNDGGTGCGLYALSG